MIKKLVIISYFEVDTNKSKQKRNSVKIHTLSALIDGGRGRGVGNKQGVWNLPKYLINGGRGWNKRVGGIFRSIC